ncbi:hypothetical protein AB1E18_007090 [Capra hircus]
MLMVNEWGNHCEFCFTGKGGLSKCGRCKWTFYCEVTCEKDDWLMHKLECSPVIVLGENWNPSETGRLIARILAIHKIHPERTPSEKYNEKKDLIQKEPCCSVSLSFQAPSVNYHRFTIEDEELSHLGSATFIFTSYVDVLYSTEDMNDYKDKAKAEIWKFTYPPEEKSCMFEDSNMYKMHMMCQAMPSACTCRTGREPCSLPLYALSLHAAKVRKTVGGPGEQTSGERALSSVGSLPLHHLRNPNKEVSDGRDNLYISEIKQELENHCHMPTF